MKHTPNKLQLYKTREKSCPYVKGQKEKLIITTPNKHAHQQTDQLIREGFRRSGDILYKPICKTCQQCTPIRIIAKNIILPDKENKYHSNISRSLKRIWKKNHDLSIKILPPIARKKHYEMLKRYIQTRHPESSMNALSFNDYKIIVENSIARTFIAEYSDQKRNIVAIAITDIISNGLSMVYDCFKSEEHKRGLGNFIILTHIKIAQNKKLAYLYPGYMIPALSNMRYKMRFKPQQILTRNQWRDQQQKNVL